MSTQYLKKQRKSRGFTLIELMIVVAVVGILVAIALPSYRSQVVRAARADAKGMLLNAAAYMNRSYNANNGSYMNASPLPAELQYSPQGSTAANAKYLVTVVTTATPSAFTLTATPANGFSDSQCGAMTINQLGLKSTAPVLAADVVRDCWIR